MWLRIPLLWLGCWGPDWTTAPEPLPDDGCVVGTASPIEDTLRLTVVVGRGRSPREAAWHIRWARHTWATQGVEVTVSGWRWGPSAPVLGRGETLAKVLAPVRPVLLRQDVPVGTVQVVMVPTLALPQSPAAQWFDPLLGLTVSPAQRDGWTEDPAQAVLDALDLPEVFVPTVFLGLDPLASLPQERARFVLAHELGHATGLSHVSAYGNLMGPGLPRCPPSLTPHQRQGMTYP